MMNKILKFKERLNNTAMPNLKQKGKSIILILSSNFSYFVYHGCFTLIVILKNTALKQFLITADFWHSLKYCH